MLCMLTWLAFWLVPLFAFVLLFPIVGEEHEGDIALAFSLAVYFFSFPALSVLLLLILKLLNVGKRSEIVLRLAMAISLLFTLVISLRLLF